MSNIHKMNYKLSIIVPVFNVAPYLRKCVDSLLAQDISDYEIILVDDGSTDNSGAICDEYAQQAKSEELRAKSISIRVIHRENGGLSAARNSGIMAAQGEYLMFVDSDDYIEQNVLCALVKRMDDDNLDVLRYNYQNVRLRSEGVNELTNERDYEVFNPNKDPKRDVDYSESVVNGETFLNERLGSACYVWQFVIKRDMISSNQCSVISDQSLDNNNRQSTNYNLLFKEGIYFEDTEWTPRMLLKAKRVASTPIVVYNYLWRTGSITLPTNSIKRMKVIEDKIALIRGFKEQQKFVLDPKWFIWMITYIAMGVLNQISILSMQERKQYIRVLKSMHIFPLYAAREKMRTHRIKIHIANISPSLYCVLMSLRVKC